MNSLNFCLSGCLSFFTIIEGKFCQVWNYQMTSFFHHFKYVIFLLLTSKISDEKSADNFTKDSLYITSHFFLAILRICLLSFDMLQIMFLSVNPFRFIYLEFIELLSFADSYLWIKFGKFVILTSLNNLSVLFAFSSSGTTITCILIYFIVSCKSLGSVHVSLFCVLSLSQT